MHVLFVFVQWRRIVVYVLLHDYVWIVCNLHTPHGTGHIENYIQFSADSQLLALSLSN